MLVFVLTRVLSRACGLLLTEEAVRASCLDVDSSLALECYDMGWRTLDVQALYECDLTLLGVTLLAPAVAAVVIGLVVPRIHLAAQHAQSQSG